MDRWDCEHSGLDKWHLKRVDAIDPSKATGGMGVRYCLRLEAFSSGILRVHGIAVYIHPGPRILFH